MRLRRPGGLLVLRQRVRGTARGARRRATERGQPITPRVAAGAAHELDCFPGTCQTLEAPGLSRCAHGSGRSARTAAPTRFLHTALARFGAGFRPTPRADYHANEASPPTQASPALPPCLQNRVPPARQPPRRARSLLHLAAAVRPAVRRGSTPPALHRRPARSQAHLGTSLRLIAPHRLR